MKNSVNGTASAWAVMASLGSLLIVSTPLHGQGFSEFILGGGGFFAGSDVINAFSPVFNADVAARHRNVIAPAGALHYWFGSHVGVGASGYYARSDVKFTGNGIDETLDAWLGGFALQGLLSVTQANAPLAVYLGPALTYTYYRGDAYQGAPDGGKKIGFGGTVGIAFRVGSTIRIHVRGDVAHHNAIFEGESAQTLGVVSLGIGFGARRSE